jgi:hypothetical protein
MFRCSSAVFVVWTILLAAAPAKAQWWSNFHDGCKRAYHRNNAWPEPFFWGDREAAMKPFGIQVANGWRRQNLLSDYHFNEHPGQLNLAGESKLRYILTQMPPSRRTVFVQRGLTPDVTAQRIELVQRASSQIIPGGFVADVVESDLPNDGWPADDVDAIARKFQATRPDPRLKDASDSEGGSGGSSSSN